MTIPITNFHLEQSIRSILKKHVYYNSMGGMGNVIGKCTFKYIDIIDDNVFVMKMIPMFELLIYI